MSDRPAILGGAPAFPDGPPGWPRPDPAVAAALAAAAADGTWGRYRGDHVPALEAALAAFHGVSHALTCASGTLAVEAALRALKVGPGDEVVLAGYEFESNFLTVHAFGARPVLVDVAPHNWNLDPAALDAAASPLTKAVVCSHLHGGLVPMRAVTEWAAARKVGVVEDAAQAPGATVDGKPAGAWGDVGTLSFGGSKLLTAGRGGALLVRDRAVFQRAKVWLHRGVQAWAPLSELHAALLHPQLAALPADTARRAGRVRVLLRELDGVPGLAAFENQGAGEPAFYKVGFRYDPGAFGLTREVFVAALRAEGVAVDVGFTSLHAGRSSSRFRPAGELREAAAAGLGCVVLHHPVLAGSDDDARRVAAAVRAVHGWRDAIRVAGPGPAGGENPSPR
ncbi:MAG TPA: aminotransferase class V-fold PLP-dependent enzyme [Urbifossiella sp.]|nr:aminotransferase class V-fold PLP-dependent enzyme [Urbifossiella sp.]